MGTGEALERHKEETQQAIVIIKTWRTKIDAYSKMVAEMKPIASKPKFTAQEVIGTFKPITYYPSRELSDCGKSLLKAKQWLGEILAFLGDISPYKNDGKRKEAKDIEPTAEVATTELIKQMGESVWQGEGEGEQPRLIALTHIERVEFLREQIKQMIKLAENDTMELYVGRTISNPLRKGYGVEKFWFVVQHLTEAKMSLGEELKRIREGEPKKNNNQDISVAGEKEKEAAAEYIKGMNKKVFKITLTNDTNEIATKSFQFDELVNDDGEKATSSNYSLMRLEYGNSQGGVYKSRKEVGECKLTVYKTAEEEPTSLYFGDFESPVTGTATFPIDVPHNALDGFGKITVTMPLHTIYKLSFFPRIKMGMYGGSALADNETAKAGK